MYHLLLCDEFSAAEAHRIGLVQEVVPAGRQTERASELAGIIARNAPLGIQATHEAGRRFIEAGEQAAVAVIPPIRERVLKSATPRKGSDPSSNAGPPCSKGADRALGACGLGGGFAMPMSRTRPPPAVRFGVRS